MDTNRWNHLAIVNKTWQCDLRHLRSRQRFARQHSAQLAIAHGRHLLASLVGGLDVGPARENSGGCGVEVPSGIGDELVDGLCVVPRLRERCDPGNQPHTLRKENP